jgi:hypothetical protein
MKLSTVNRFVRVNLVGLLALLNMSIVFLKFKIERPAPVVCKCSGIHSKTNLLHSSGSPVSLSNSPSLSSPLAPPAVPVRHKVQGDWEGDLKETSCNYYSMTDGQGPLLSNGEGRYYRRGDLTRWGRILWIGPDFFTTEKYLVKLSQVEPVIELAKRGES